MMIASLDMLESQIEPCEGCGEEIDIDARGTYNFSPTGVVCSGCEERQIAFENVTEVCEELVVI